MGFINWANNVCHIPVFEDWVYYNFWFWAWWWGPLLGSLICLHDIVTGFFFRCVHATRHNAIHRAPDH
jgi:hypothetical protein